MKKSPLKSRKLWLAIIGAALVIANQGLGLNLPAEDILWRSPGS